MIKFDHFKISCGIVFQMLRNRGITRVENFNFNNNF